MAFALPCKRKKLVNTAIPNRIYKSSRRIYIIKPSKGAEEPPRPDKTRD